MEAISTYPGELVMPDGTKVSKGGKVVLTDDDKANAGVSEWLGLGYFVDAKDVPIPKPAPDVDALEADNADLAAKVAALEAEIEKLTAPASTPAKK